MRRLSLIIPILGFLFVFGTGDSPHGNDFKLNCQMCHNSEGWKYNPAYSSFNHNNTAFALTGQHTDATCRKCHSNLIFAEAKPNCNSCHTDMHNQRLGDDCTRCHSTNSWLVTNITEIHRETRFPLTGAHAVADCAECHKSVSLLQFDIHGIACIDCHSADYQRTTNPNHQIAGLPIQCDECHKVNAFEWNSSGFSHAFFPLTLGHNINTCNQCHQGSVFSGLSPQCSNCHQNDFNISQNPNHVTAGFTTNCTECHTTNPGWTPANFDHGSFQLNLGHSGVSCEKCHISGNYSNTSSNCSDCHLANYTNTQNPNHVQADFPTTCADCHNTNPGWSPATFNHNSFALTLGHSNVACTNCHIGGNYSGTSPVCSNCHINDFNLTTNPNHVTAQFPTTCNDCHTTNPGWKPATFNHDGLYFPIYSGKHNGEWNTCSDCHTNSSDYSVFNCLNCHEHNQASMTSEHNDVQNFQYISSACLNCHPTGNGD